MVGLHLDRRGRRGMSLLGQRSAQDHPRADHVDVVAVEPQQDPLAGQRLGAVANDGRRLRRPGEDQRLPLHVDHALLARGRPRAALHAHVAADGESFHGLAAGDGFRPRRPRFPPRRGLLRVLGDGVLAGDVEIPAREVDVAVEDHPAVLGLDPHVARVEIERTRGKRGRRQKDERADHRRPSICSFPTTPLVSWMALPSLRASIPRPSTR